MLGWLAGALLFAAVAAWLKLRRGPLLPEFNRHVTARTADLESASTLRISRNTTKVHLHSIFRKTGTNRQSQLVHLLSKIERG